MQLAAQRRRCDRAGPVGYAAGATAREPVTHRAGRDGGLCRCADMDPPRPAFRRGAAGCALFGHWHHPPPSGTAAAENQGGGCTPCAICKHDCWTGCWTRQAVWSNRAERWFTAPARCCLPRARSRSPPPCNATPARGCCTVPITGVPPAWQSPQGPIRTRPDYWPETWRAGRVLHGADCDIGMTAAAPISVTAPRKGGYAGPASDRHAPQDDKGHGTGEQAGVKQEPSASAPMDRLAARSGWAGCARPWPSPRNPNRAALGCLRVANRCSRAISWWPESC